MKRFTKISAMTLAASTALGGAAFAGTLEAPIVEQQPVYTPAPVVAANDWTGFYTGLQLGYADVDVDDGSDGDNGTYGFHAGYDYEFDNNFILGGELDYDKTDIDFDNGGEVDSIARAKLKAGYDLGNTMVYATAGAARADINGDDETGPFAGIGMNYKVTDRYTVGAELLHHKFDDVSGIDGNDADATTFTVRGSLRF